MVPDSVVTWLSITELIAYFVVIGAGRLVAFSPIGSFWSLSLTSSASTPSDYFFGSWVSSLLFLFHLFIYIFVAALGEYISLRPRDLGFNILCTVIIISLRRKSQNFTVYWMERSDFFVSVLRFHFKLYWSSLVFFSILSQAQVSVKLLLIPRPTPGLWCIKEPL